ncbi:MAG TPA: GNAT family N-acetyltransferase [Rhodanobacteraceae bacterium]|nr:GNAT family N-acetyltransferase [Rhodanobacteraceae bacterium]
MSASIHIRAAASADAESLARLSGQLGYPADAAAIARRLRDIEQRRAGAVLVAEIDGVVAGWAHVLPQHRMEHDANAELAGLVVDERMRGAGIGAALLHAVEAWAREHGYPELIVRSNVIRERAHRFYLREGYTEKKRQAVFVKKMI